jgi:(S)-ureidoglycine aminohydrolase
VHNLGQTRSSQQANHLLLTADTFVRTSLPGMKRCSAIVHAGPAMGAKFTQYTAEFEAGGELGSTPAQRFIFVMEGVVTLEVEGKRHELSARGYAYLPEDAQHRVVAEPHDRYRKAVPGAGPSRSATSDHFERGCSVFASSGR